MADWLPNAMAWYAMTANGADIDGQNNAASRFSATVNFLSAANKFLPCLDQMERVIRSVERESESDDILLSNNCQISVAEMKRLRDSVQWMNEVFSE